MSTTSNGTQFGRENPRPLPVNAFTLELWHQWRLMKYLGRRARRLEAREHRLERRLVLADELRKPRT